MDLDEGKNFLMLSSPFQLCFEQKCKKNVFGNAKLFSFKWTCARPDAFNKISNVKLRNTCFQFF